MKNYRKIFIRVMPVIMGIFLMSSSVFGIAPSLPAAAGSKLTGITDLAGSLWQTASVVIQILAIAAIVIAGVRYMFASASDKADIKKQTFVLVVGAILVFAAVPIAKFISDVATTAVS